MGRFFVQINYAAKKNIPLPLPNNRITNIEATVVQSSNIAAWQEGDVILSALICFITFLYKEITTWLLHHDNILIF